MSGLLRWGGGGLVLLAAFLLTHGLCSLERTRLAQTEAYLELFRLVRGQIACYSRPFAEICRHVEPRLLAACGLSAAGNSLEAMLADADLLLADEAERVVRGFAHELGRGYKDEQLAVCDTAVAELDAIAARTRQRLPEKLRLIRCCTLCGALAVILLLL